MDEGKISEERINDDKVSEGKLNEDKIIEERREKAFNLLKKPWVWAGLFLIIALILGVYIRSLPMQDHGGRPGLWDITTNTWTLGPDLDPWLFLRSAKAVVEQGALPKVDYMRNVPLGFDNSLETPLLPYMIAWTYYLFHFFNKNVNIEFAGVVFPVVMFFLTILSFFFFVREVFIRKSKESEIKANIIALISTFFMILIPEFLARTVAGIPEKESAAFFFIFLAFYLFLKAWKSEKLNISIIFGILAGISTGMMALIWGGFVYIFIPIPLSIFIAFVLNKVHKKEIIIYSLWLIFSTALMIIFSGRFILKGMLVSVSTGPAFFLIFVILIDLILWNEKFSKIFKFKFLKEPKIPKTIISMIVSFILVILIIFIWLGPTFLIDRIGDVHQTIFKPVTGRWSTTVAENRQPYFTEWSQSFGPFLKNIPILFWLFFIGSIVLFKKMISSLDKKHAWILTFLYLLFLFGVIFSRYAPHPAVLDGDGIASKTIYYLSVFLLTGFFVYYYIDYSKKGNKIFESIDYEFLLLFSLFILTLLTARGAVRLILVLAPIAPIFVGYLIVESVSVFIKMKEETWKVILGAFVIVILLLSVFTLWTYYQTMKSQAYGYIPSYYNYQWQKAMEWVRNETPKNAVFAHWWDYGYWVQSIGNRATVVDGGNAIVFWNYWMGRLVLTGDNQKDALEFLYNHNATHLLIDSSDIGKYGAFASIGSDKNFDRYSWIGTLLLDEKQTQETNNQTLMVYPGGIASDEDININENGKSIYLPGQRTGIGAIIVPLEKNENETIFAQPYAIMVYNNKQYKVNLRYLSVNGKFMDFKTGIEATAFVFPQIIPQGQGVGKNTLGSMMYLSPRLMRGFLAQKYILNDPFNKFPNFKVVHSESSIIVESLNNQGMNLPEFVYYQGIQGPIKIWSIKYNGDEQVKQEYLDTDASKYLDWKF